MNYKNGEVILPPDLLERLQEYAEGEIIYIPRKEKQRTHWGERSGTRQLIIERNREIYDLFNKGVKIEDIALSFFLSVDSIRKIIRSIRSANGSNTINKKESL